MSALIPRLVDRWGARLSQAPDQLEIDVRRGSLDPSAKEAYDQLLPQLRHGATQAHVTTPCDTTMVQKAYTSLVHDHPEFFWLNAQGEVGCKITSLGDHMLLEPRQAIPTVERDRTWRQMTAVVRDIVSAAPLHANCYDSVRYAYEWMCGHVAYDLTAPRGQTAAGALVDRRAVCAGCAQAFCLILRSMHIPCGSVAGSTFQGDGHLWNIVRIDGTHSFVDCTNGRLDSGLSPYRAGGVPLTYRYLCFSTPELLRRYRFDREQTVPLCLSDAYDWFSLNSQRVGPVFSMEQLDSLLSSACANGARATEVKFASKQAHRAGMRAIESGDLLRGRFGALLNAAGHGGQVMLSMSHDDTMRTLTVGW